MDLKDTLDHLCATDPTWVGALQLVQLAKSQTNQNGPGNVYAAGQLVCAIVLLASEATDPQTFLEYCASSLRKTPLTTPPP